MKQQQQRPAKNQQFSYVPVPRIMEMVEISKKKMCYNNLAAT